MGSDLCAYLPDQLTLELGLEQAKALGASLDPALIRYLQESSGRASVWDQLTLEIIGLQARVVDPDSMQPQPQYIHRRFAVFGNERRVGAAPRLSGAWRQDLMPKVLSPETLAGRKAYALSRKKYSRLSNKHWRLSISHLALARGHRRLTRRYPRSSSSHASLARVHSCLSVRHSTLSTRYDILSARHHRLSRRLRIL